MKRTAYFTAIVMSIIFLLTSISLRAQEGAEDNTELSEKAKQLFNNLTITGSVDAYFRANINNSNDESTSATLAPATSFANLPGFALGMANIAFTYEHKSSGFVADLVFGPRGQDAVFDAPRYLTNNNGTSNVINQLYVYWGVTDALTLSFGNFNTFLGYELISPTANFNYSTSYLFSYGPFSHTGLKADIDLGSGWSLMAGLLNPTDITEYNPFGDYFGGLQLGYDFGVGSAYINGLFGEDYTQIDLTAGADINDELYLGLNASITDAHYESGADAGFSGAAIYVQYGLSDQLKLGTRAEYFTDNGIHAFTTEDMDKANVLAITASANYMIGNLTFIPELRIDTYDEDVISDADGQSQSTLLSFVLAAVYGF